jgi:carbon-monoxide dehydrogenase large subunit
MELNEPRRQPRGPESWLGVAVPRREDARFLTGTAVYAADVRPEGLLHAAFVRSPIASATGLTADVGLARDAPGVVAVFTADDRRRRR